ncbi:MAG: hypothetical protein AB7O57_00010 [Hyphomicrobiaceae bacterium]
MKPARNLSDDGFGDRLRLAAALAGGLRALSRASGVSEAMLYRYLAGRCDIPRRALLALAGAAGVDAGWLVAGEDAQRGQANDAAQSSGTDQSWHLRTRSRAGPSGRS